MFKLLRRLAALSAVVFVAVKGFFALISWMEATEDSKNIWDDDDHDVNAFEEV